MSKVQKMTNPEGMFFITMTIVYWIDLFTRKVYRDIFIESLTFCHFHKGLNIHAFVIMGSHVHMIVSARDGAVVSDIVRDLKKFTSRKFYEAAQTGPESRREWMLFMFDRAGKHNSNNHNFQIWQQDNHPVILESLKFLWQKLDYIHDNPVAAGIVYAAKDYVYSSASAYLGHTEESLLPLTLFDTTDRHV